MERVGILGGTFDPVHTGHVVAAAGARHALDLDRVLLVVAADPWQKRGHVVAAAADRLAMVEAAIEGIDGVEASALEIERGGPSYTVDTLAALTRPDRALFLIVGADTVGLLPSWHRAGDLAALATLAVVERAGIPAEPPTDLPFRAERIVIPRLDISSTDLRARIAAGTPVDGLIPPAAVRVLRERRLYTPCR
jgi:nicotinate-nucleotide adenylyltransferase